MPSTAQAMVLSDSQKPLELKQITISSPQKDELLIKVKACGVCRTDLHICDGELHKPKLPLIPGHEIVGEIIEIGNNVEGFHVGQKVGVPWLAKTCNKCFYCLNGKENLCDRAIFTGYTKDGGYTNFTTVFADYCFPLDNITNKFTDSEIAPLMCAGLIGWRSYKFTNDATKIGIYGFGAAAHIITQIAKCHGKEIFAFTKPNDNKKQNFALRLGAKWAGSTNKAIPELLDAAIIFAPDGNLIPHALKSIKKGGIVVLGGIHMSDIPNFPYDIIWGERKIQSVANLTRADASEFIHQLENCPIKTQVKTYDLKDANQALCDLKAGNFEGAAVLIPDNQHSEDRL